MTLRPGSLRLGIADHLGWAVAITADDRHRVVDRRRIALVEPDLSPAPIHYEGPRLGLAATEELVARVRASVQKTAKAAFAELEAALPRKLASMSLRALPASFPTAIADQLVAPYEARADAVMYRTLLVEAAQARGWQVCFYDARTVLAEAEAALGDDADAVLEDPRRALGPPWTKDHRVALAATVVAG